MRIISILLLLFIAPYKISFSQVTVNEAWVRTYNGPAGGPDGGKDIAVDSAGNAVVAASSRGIGTGLDFFLIKYSPDGDTLWTRRYNGSGNGNDLLRDMALDEAGNIYVTGVSWNVNGNYDVLTLKYSSAGTLLATMVYDNGGNDEGRAIAIDGSGNIYVCGASEGNVTGTDYILVQYDGNGNYLWEQRYDGGGQNDYPTAVNVDATGKIVITGFIQDGTDTAKRDIVTIKYNTAGIQQWLQTWNGNFNGDDRATAMAIDNNGFIFLTGFTETDGSGMNLVTIQYNSSGQLQWANEYNGPANQDDMGFAIAVDNTGNSYVTGTNFTTTYLFHDFVTIKYNSSGDTVWVRRYNGPGNSNDIALGIVLDDSANVYVTGYNFTIINHDYATIKYSNNGTEQWVMHYNGSLNGDDGATAIAVDKNQNVYVTGIANSSFGLFYPGFSLYSDIATVKYGQQEPPPSVNDIDLGVARYFALLSDSDIISSDSTIAIGNIGAQGTVSPVIFSTDTLFPSGHPRVQQALDNLGKAIALMEKIPADTISGTLGGKYLPAGVYQISGSALLNGTLTLTGSPASVYLFRIADSLLIDSNAQLRTGNVHPHNIYLLAGSAVIGKNAQFPGILIGKNNITSRQGNTGNMALMTKNGNIYLSNNSITAPPFLLSQYYMEKLAFATPPSVTINANDIGVCGDTVSFDVSVYIDTILKGGSINFYPLQILVSLPAGLEYLSGSVLSNIPGYSVTELPGSTPQQPLFGVKLCILFPFPPYSFCIPLGPDTTVTLTFSVVASCEALTTDSLTASAQAVFVPLGDTLNDVSNSFLVLSPILNLSQSTITLPSIAANVKDTVCRTVTLYNNGNAPLLNEFTITETYGGAIELVSLDVLTALDANTVFIDTSANIISITGKDTTGGILPDSGFTFKECFVVLHCTDDTLSAGKDMGKSEFSFYWACTATNDTCQRGGTTANIYVPSTNIAQLTITGPFLNEDICYGPDNNSNVEVSIANIGAGPAFDVRLILGGGFQYIAADTPFYLIEGNDSILLTPDSVSYGSASTFCQTPYLGYATFTLGDIPKGKSKILRFNTKTCCPDSATGLCGDRIKYLPYMYSYHDQCAADTDSVSVTSWQDLFYGKAKLRPVTMIGPGDLHDWFDTIPFKGDTGHYSFKYFTFIPWNSDGSATIKAVFQLDGGLCYLDNSLVWTDGTRTWSPDSVIIYFQSIDSCSGTVTVFFPIITMPDSFDFISSSLNLSFIAQCPAPAVSHVNILMYYLPSTLCTNSCEMALSCDKIKSTNIHCPGCDKHGVQTVKANFFRKNLGLADVNNDGVADATAPLDTSLIAFNTVMVGDTLIGNVVATTGTLDWPQPVPQYRYAYYELTIPQNCAPYLTAIGAEIEIHDKKVDTIYEFPFPANKVQNLSSNVYLYDLSIDTLHQYGLPLAYDSFQVSWGDIILIKPMFVVTGNIGADDELCDGMINFAYLGSGPKPNCEVPLCKPDSSIGGVAECVDTVPQCDAAVQYWCERWDGSFTLLGYYFERLYGGTPALVNCSEGLAIYNWFYIGKTQYGESIFDWFPYEYRNWGNNDTAWMEIPDGFTFDSAQLVMQRQEGNNASYYFSEKIYTVMPDYSIGDTLFFLTSQYFSSNTSFSNTYDSLFYFPDDENGFSLTVFIRPRCNTPSYPNPGQLFTAYLSYEPAFVSASAPTLSGKVPFAFIYNAPQIEVQNTQPSVDGQTETVCWNVLLQNLGAGNGSHIWLAPLSPSGRINVQEIIIETTPLTEQNGIYQVGDLVAFSSEEVKICATYGCTQPGEDDSLLLLVGWDCPEYPVSADSAACPPDTFVLYLNPQPAGLYQNVIFIPDDTIDICDTVDALITVTTNNASSVYDITVAATLPAGLNYAALSGEIIYVGDTVAAEPLQTENILVWNMDNYTAFVPDSGLPGSGTVNNTDSMKFLLRFKLTGDCNLLPGNKISITTTGFSPCGDTVTLPAFTKNFIIRNYPAPTAKTLTLSSTPFSSCDSIATVDVIIVNSDTVTSSNGDVVYIALPSCIDYNNNFVADTNPPQNTIPAISASDDTLAWYLPGNIPSGDTIRFSFDMIATAGCTPGNYSLMGWTTLRDSNLFCAITGENCGIDLKATATTVTAVFPPPLADSITKTNVFCLGICTGVAAATATGGTPPYLFLWSTGDTTAATDSLCAGMYAVTVTDSFGCTLTDTLTITEPSTLTTTTTKLGDVTCADTCNGSATVNSNGGAPPYNYLWSNGNSTFADTSLCSGTHGVTVTDTNGCAATDSVTITEPVKLTLDASATNVSCFGGSNGSTTVTASGGTPPYVYNWSNGSPQSTINNLQSAIYYVTVTDANNCLLTDTIIITEPAPLTLSANISGCIPACTGAIALVVNGGITPYSILWDPAVAATNENSADSLCAGAYLVTISDSNFCTVSDTFHILNGEPFLLTLTKRDENCYGDCSGTATANVTGGATPYIYLWNNGAALSALTGLCNGEIKVTVTDANGCAITAADTIKAVVRMFVDASISDDTVCFGETVTLSAAGDSTFKYEWIKKSPFDTGASVFAIGQFITDVPNHIPVTVYILITSDTVSGCRVKDTVQVYVIYKPTAAFTFNPYGNCEDQTQVFFTNTSEAYSPTTYIWNFNDGYKTDTLIATTYPYTYSDTNRFPYPGYYYVTLTAKNVCFSDTASHIIYIIPSASGHNPNCCINTFLYVNPFSSGASITIGRTVSPASNPVHWKPSMGKFQIQGTLYIERGAGLYVDPGVVVEFGPQGRVIVDWGGALILDNATFTSVDFTGVCPDNTRMMWFGIEVWGNSGKRQTGSDSALFQGKIILRNGAKVEDAYNGITLGKSKLEWLPLKKKTYTWGPVTFQLYPSFRYNFYDAWYGGGILITGNSKYNRNGGGIKFLTYRSNNRSDIEENQFTCKTNNINSAVLDPYCDNDNTTIDTNNAQNDYNDGVIRAHNPHRFATPDGRSWWGLRTQYNFFASQIPAGGFGNPVRKNRIDYSYWGTYLLNTRGTMRADTFINILKGAVYLKNYFTNLFFHRVDSNVFLPDNASAVVIDGGTYDILNKNIFNRTVIPPIFSGAQNNNIYGIGLNATKNYWIYDNEFTRLQTGIYSWGATSPSLIGYQFSGNIFTQCSTGVRLPYNNPQLLIRCGTFNNPDTSEYYRNWNNTGTLSQQGQFDSTDIEKPGGSRFNLIPDALDTSRKQIRSTVAFNYFAHQSPAEYVPVKHGAVNIDATSISCPGYNDCCDPPPPYPSLVFQQLAQDSALLLQLLAEYNAIQSSLDHGQTQTLLNAINSAMPPGKLKNLLLQNSLLSDTVLIALITRTPPLPPGILKDILLPNLPVSVHVWNYLENILSTLPPGIAQQIRSAQLNNPSVRTLTSVTRDIEQLELHRGLLINELIRYYVEADSTEPAVSLLQQEKSVDAKQTLVGVYLNDSNYTAAQAELNAMPLTTPDNIAFYELYTIYLDLLVNGRTLWDMDTLQIQTVGDIATMCPPSLAAVNAREVLFMVFGLEIPECDFSAPQAKWSGDDDGHVKTLHATSQIAQAPTSQTDDSTTPWLGDNIPNPFSNTTVIPYWLPEDITHAQIKINDITGQTIKIYPVTPGSEEIEISLNEYDNGVYFYSLILDSPPSGIAFGKPLATEGGWGVKPKRMVLIK